MTMFSCISDDENWEATFNRDVKKIEEYIQTVETEYMRKETIGDTGVVLLFTEVNDAGEVPKNQDTLYVDYTGYLLDGTVFDTSNEDVAKDNGIHNTSRTYEPYRIELGVSLEITGWHIALSQMKEGEKAIALIPSGYAYGSQANGPIPANSVLAFDLDLVEVRSHQQQ
jgi:FKBP-type peptidyl-prolyl cis-trans isomerase FklB